MNSNTATPVRKTMKAADVRFFWTDGGDRNDDRMFHWCLDCPWVMAAAWHGARVSSSESPPPDAERKNVAFVRRFLEEHLQGPAWSTGTRPGAGEAQEAERWLCEVCSQYVPRPVAAAFPDRRESCRKCGCSREMHACCRGPFDTGCGMRWVDMDYGADPDPGCIRLIHCPCDGYEPPTGGKSLKPADFATG